MSKFKFGKKSTSYFFFKHLAEVSNLAVLLLVGSVCIYKAPLSSIRSLNIDIKLLFLFFEFELDSPTHDLYFILSSLPNLFLHAGVVTVTWNE